MGQLMRPLYAGCPHCGEKLMYVSIADGNFHCSNCGNWTDVKIKKGHISIIVPKEDIVPGKQVG